jgi:hypothetical protein
MNLKEHLLQLKILMMAKEVLFTIILYLLEISQDIQIMATVILIIWAMVHGV